MEDIKKSSFRSNVKDSTKKKVKRKTNLLVDDVVAMLECQTSALEDIIRTRK